MITGIKDVYYSVTDVIRVYFKIDEENTGSRLSIERIGAKIEGCLRNDWILPQRQSLADSTGYLTQHRRIL